MELEHLPSAEQEHFTQVINSLFIVGWAARDIDNLIRFRWDRHKVQGQPLQEQAIEILRDAGMAGIDRINGDTFTHSVAHSVYDQLYDQAPETSYDQTVERLQRVSATKWNLLNVSGYEMSPSEEEAYRNDENQLVLVVNKFLRNQFMLVALHEYDSKNPSYANLLQESVYPEAGGAFLSWKDCHEMIEFARSMPEGEEADREERFWEWAQEQGHNLRAKRLGNLAINPL